MYLVNDQLFFPPVEDADEDGLLAIGGDLSTERLLLAYRSGIFPWYNEDDPICWWSPDPRCVLFPSNIRVSRSMQQVIRRNQYSFTLNNAFEEVMRQCQTTRRAGEYGTWIQDEMIEAYSSLHRLGYACSAEAWCDGKLAGGLYGVRIGKVFFGESMFSQMPNASKFAFIQFVQLQQQEGVQLIDCQVRSEHLLSLGAVMIGREQFIEYLNRYC